MRLLLAEDERSLSKAIAAILTKNNYSVDTVYDGAEALMYLQSEQYDGAILDIMMPKMDGITVIKRARQDGCRTPVLILSARSEVDDKVQGLDSGANDYLTKPFEAKELLARIRAMTRSGQEQTDSRLTFGNVTLDCASYELYAPGGNYKLANKEFQMMEMLLQHPRHLIASERFLERIWGYDSETELNVVWVYISYLRKKLEAIGADIQIRVQRNSGYCLEERK